MTKRRPKLYHATVSGIETGIFQGHFDRDGIRGLVDGYSGAVYQGFDTLREAVEWYITRSGSMPSYIEWFDCLPDEIPLENIEIKSGDKDALISISLSRSSGRGRGETFQGVEIKSQDIGRWGEAFAVKALVNKLSKKYEGQPEKAENGFTIRNGCVSQIVSLYG